MEEKEVHPETWDKGNPLGKVDKKKEKGSSKVLGGAAKSACVGVGKGGGFT